MLHQAHCLRQCGRHCRDKSDQQQTADDGHIVHKHIRHDLGKRGAAHLDAHEQCIAHGRGNVADAQVIYEDQTELYRAHAKALADGQEQRGEDKDGRGHIHEGAGHQQDHVHDEQDHILVAGQAEQSSRHSIRDLQEGHDPAQNVGNAYQKHHHAGHLGRVHNDLPQALQVDGTVAESQHERVDDRDGRALGGREHAADDAADDHDDQGQRRQGAQGAYAEIFPVELAGSAFIAQLDSQQHAHHTAAQCPDDAGDVTGHEQRSH